MAFTCGIAGLFLGVVFGALGHSTFVRDAEQTCSDEVNKAWDWGIKKEREARALELEIRILKTELAELRKLRGLKGVPR